MKTKCFLLSLVLLKVLTFSSYAHAQDDDDIVIPDNQESFNPTSSGSTPPVIIDESDSSDVSDVEEYDG